MNFTDRRYFPFILLFLIVFISRLPFLSAGFGVEEDSWGIALAGIHTALTGVYEPSRFPGHPVHEFIYSAFPFYPAVFYNLFSAFFSAVAAVFFALILKHLKFRHYLVAAIALAFTPVFYVSSTYTIDFVWTLTFVLISLYALLKDQFIICGIFLGLAIGCRITSGAMILPFAIIFWQQHDLQGNFKKGLRIAVPLILVSMVSYLPLFKEFGLSFFMYYDQFPYPGFAKVVYKMVPGVFGFLGIVGMLICFVAMYRKRREIVSGALFENGLDKRIVYASFAVIILFTISYFRLPQKSGYMITIIPFVILLAGYYLNSKLFNFLCWSFVLSSFFCSINLTDKLRGAEYSKLAVKFPVAGQELFFDPLTGPIFSDYSKRKQKMKYVEEVVGEAKRTADSTVLIAGWWYNEIMVELSPRTSAGKVVFEPYMDTKKMLDYNSNRYQIRFLPEQNIYNDLMFDIRSTDSLASPF